MDLIAEGIKQKLIRIEDDGHGLQEGILGGILRLGRVLKQSPCRIPGIALVAAYDLAERLDVALGDVLHEFFIGIQVIEF